MSGPGRADEGFRVAILSDGVSPWVMGGIQRHSRMLAIELARAGVEVALFHTVRNQADRVAAESLADFPADALPRLRSFVVDYPKPGRYPGHYIGDSWRYSRRLLERYRAEDVAADFIYAQGLTGLAFAEARKTSPGCLPPVGVNQHGYEMFQRAADVKSYLQQLMLRGPFARLARDADCVFSFPGKIRRIVRERCRVPDDRIIEIPNAIDASWIRADRPAPGEHRRFVFVGRFERRKGVPELMQAIERCGAANAEFHFIGPIPRQSQLDRPNVIYHGPISDTARIQEVLDSCDVLVCPSFAEGMPTVVLEAMSRGLAIIATDVGATAAWVDAANGIILPISTVEGIGAAIATLVALPDAGLGLLQRESLRRAHHFTWDTIANTTLVAVVSRISVPAGVKGTKRWA